MSRKYSKTLKRNIRISELKCYHDNSLILHIINNFCKSSPPIKAFILIFIENKYLLHVFVLRQTVSLRKLWNTWELYEKQWDISQDHNQIKLLKTQPPETAACTKLKGTGTKGKTFQ